MPDLDERFDALKRMRPPDLWTDIEGRQPRAIGDPGPSPLRRVAIAVLAFAVAVAGFGFAYVAFHGTKSPVAVSPTPVVPPAAEKIAAMVTRGSGIAAVDGAEIAVIDPVTGVATQITHAGSSGMSARWPAWSPDGTRIAFVLGDLHQPDVLAGVYDIAVMNADGSDVRLVTTGLTADQPTWSPDGTHIAFIRDQGSRLSVVDLATGSVRDLWVPKTGAIQTPSWSPDGSQIAVQEGPGKVDVYAVSVETGTVRRLTHDDGGYPAWSPDGSRIAFRRGADIWIMSANGTDPTKLTDCHLPACVQARSPAWSPQESQIVFAQQDEGGREDLFVIGADGTGLRQLTSGPGQYNFPSWRPTEGAPPTPTISPVAASVSDPANVTAPFAARAIAYGEGHVWVSYNDRAGGHVAVLDPNTLGVTSTIDHVVAPSWESGGGGIATGFGSLWIQGDGGHMLDRIDAGILHVDAQIPLPRGLSVSDISVSQLGVYVLVRGDDGGDSALLGIDPDTNAVRFTTPLPALVGRHVFVFGSSIG